MCRREKKEKETSSKNKMRSKIQFQCVWHAAGLNCSGLDSAIKKEDTEQADQILNEGKQIKSI